MLKLVYTDNIGFDMRDWEREPIIKVFAGTGCIMAVTEDGRTLQKIKDSSNAAAVKYWTRIQEISLSAWMSGVAIGLVSDGTCLIAKRPVRFLTSPDNFEQTIPFDTVNNRVKSWNHIVQTAVSDTFFALNDEGKVVYSPLSRYTDKDYRNVLSWNNIGKIVVGLQNSIIGITKDGRLCCAGADLLRGPHGDVRARLASYTDVTDVCMTGSECEEILIAHRDGTVGVLGRNEILPVKTLAGEECVLKSHFTYTVFILDENRNLIRFDRRTPTAVFPQGTVISSFAVGDYHYEPFVIALAETGR